MDIPTLAARPVAECTSEEVAFAINRGFENYFVSLAFTAPIYERRFRSEHLDPFASRVYSHDGSPAGALLIDRRGWTSRVAAMGIAPEFRGRGVGRRILEEAIAEARARGDRAMLLEVIVQNAPAVALYTGLGFRTRRRLSGYRWDPVDIEPTGPLEEIDPRDFARLAVREGEPDLPWTLQPETFAASTPPTRAWRLGEARALMGDPAAAMQSLHALVVPRAHRRQGWGTRILHALAAAHPGRTWWFSSYIPQDLAPEFFTGPGWDRQGLEQWEMRLEI
ncbi:MAG TPA: GNAT family N-acetyltransferase [Thermoanaerobaculia bacterium]|jgi:ribosomal protein S18 acetylase RimI-like enzyme|nr:GNAT family N-acetyltransferase [Thermoanaerobaculia bacterium]